MRELPILVIGKCRYQIDAEHMELIKVGKPSDKITMGIVPHMLHTDVMIFYDEKKQCRYYPAEPGDKLPSHVVVYEFPALEFLDPVGFALRTKAGINLDELKMLDPGITIAIRHKVSQDTDMVKKEKQYKRAPTGNQVNRNKKR